jgi:hypothetical protein
MVRGCIIERRESPGYGSPGARFAWREMQPFRPAAGLAATPVKWRTLMTTFDDREKTFERKFALDQDLKFRAESRRNRLLAEWAAAKLGIAGDQLPDYVRSVVKADLEEKGDEDVFRKLHNDFAAAGVKVSETELRTQMVDMLAKAVADIETAGKP